MNQDQKVVALIKHGGGIAGGATGGVIGFLTGGPIGAMIGGGLGAAIQHAAVDVAERVLSHREKMRVGATMAYAVELIRERADRGDKPREDGFFRPDQTGRSKAEEIFEGALLKMKSEHEEQKARFYGHLFANVSFDATCSPSEANYLLHLMDGLTYTQLCLVSLFSDAQRFPNLPSDNYEGKRIPAELSHVLAATYELYQRELVNVRPRGDENLAVVFQGLEIPPAHLMLSDTGKRLFKFAGLATIGSGHELQALANLFSAVVEAGEGVILGRAAPVLTHE